MTRPLRTGYMALLDGIVVDGKQVPAFDMMATYPDKTPYIIISGITPISDNTKDTFMSEVTVDLLVYTSYKGDFGGRKLADQIEDRVLQLVIPSPGRSGVSAEGFNVYMAKQVSTDDELFESDTRNTYRKRITIEHLVEEL